MSNTIGISRVRAWYILAVIIVATFAASINRQILFLVIEPLKLEMNLSDADIGILTGLAPGILAGTGALLLGWLTDRMPRHLLLGVCILVWSVATAAMGVAYTFAAFLVGVLALALGETAITPVANSLIPDIFARRQRVLANLIFFAAGGVAAGMGALFSGLLLSWVKAGELEFPVMMQALTDWRKAFMLVALVGGPLALLVLTIGHVTRRSTGDKSFNDYESLQHYGSQHGVAAAGLYFAIAMTSFGGLAVGTWTPSYVIRLYGTSPADVGFALGLVATAGGILGVALAAIAIHKLFPRYGALTPRLLYQNAMLLTIVPVVLQLYATTAMQAYLLYGAQIMLATLGTALSSTMIQDISPAKYRGRLFGISVLVVTVLSSVAPFIVGVISDQFGDEPRGLLWAIMLVAVPALLLSALSISMTNKQYEASANIMAVN